MNRNILNRLPTLWTARGEFRENSAAERALMFIMYHPIFTVNQLCENLKISPPAGNRATAKLVEKKIVRERTGFGRNRLFAAEEVIELLSRPFGEDPSVALERANELLMTKMV